MTPEGTTTIPATIAALLAATLRGTLAAEVSGKSDTADLLASAVVLVAASVI